MALYRVVLRLAFNEALGAFKWSNVFYTDQATPLAAAAWGIDLWDDAWRLAHSNLTFCYEVYASDLVLDTDNYITLSHGLNPNIFGAKSPSGELMPSWNVARMDLSTPAGRPSRKFIRSPWGEGDIVFDSFGTAAQTALQNAGTALFTLGGAFDEDGQPFTGFTLRGVSNKRLGKLASLGVPSKPIVSG